MCGFNYTVLHGLLDSVGNLLVIHLAAARRLLSIAPRTKIENEKTKRRQLQQCVCAGYLGIHLEKLMYIKYIHIYVSIYIYIYIIMYIHSIYIYTQVCEGGSDLASEAISKFPFELLYPFVQFDPM